MGDIAGIVITRGEVNQTTYKSCITKNPAHARLLKGVEVGQYRLKTQLSQGEVPWVDAKKLAKARAIPDRVETARIATQRITGVDERMRIVACMAQAGWHFADSTNSISFDPTCKYSPDYVIAILNSTLFQWRFKLTSSNNNVGTNELEAMPFRILNFKDTEDRRMHDSLASQARSAAKLAVKVSAAQSDRARESDEIMFRETLELIDDAVFALYGLSRSDQAVIRT